MSVLDFINKHQAVDASIGMMARNAVSELDAKLNGSNRQKPEHIASQSDLITNSFNTDEKVWIFFFDGGRYDIFDQLVWDYMDGNLERVWNGGVGYTGDWSVHNLSGDFGNRGLFSFVPLRELRDVDYDGREHFKIAPDINGHSTVHDRLAELGYRQRKTGDNIEISPRKVNQEVKENKDKLNGGVIRYIAPHPPFDGLEDLTSEDTKAMKTQNALDRGDLTYAELTSAYLRTYKKAFNYAIDLIPQLGGRIIITADHGTCLTCGQLFHGSRLKKHDHLTIVPWFELDRIL